MVRRVLIDKLQPFVIWKILLILINIYYKYIYNFINI